MANFCIYKDQNNNAVYAEVDGKKSRLFDALLSEDPNNAETKYKVSKTPGFKEQVVKPHKINFQKKVVDTINSFIESPKKKTAKLVTEFLKSRGLNINILSEQEIKQEAKKRGYDSLNDISKVKGSTQSLNQRDQIHGFYDTDTGEIYLTEELLSSKNLVHEMWHAFRPVLKQKAAQGDQTSQSVLKQMETLSLELLGGEQAVKSRFNNNRPFDNKSSETQDFFSDVVSGKSDKFKPKKPWKPILSFSEAEKQFKKVYGKYKGNFDEHIATSIPTFRETQIKVGQAITSMLSGGGLIYDIGGSEGGFVKSITEVSEGNIKSINLDPNPDMKKVHEESPVEGSDFVQEAFYEGFDNYKKHVPQEKADVVHESMVFQFITPERKDFVKEVKENYIKENGIFLTEEKLLPNSEEEWLSNENKKSEYKLKYYSQKQLTTKSEEVLVGMKKNQTYEEDYVSVLKDNFDYVGPYWDSGNFKGYIATDSKQNFDKFFKELGGKITSEYSSKPIYTLSEEITDMTEGSDLTSDLKEDYKKILESKDEGRRSEIKFMTGLGSEVYNPREGETYEQYKDRMIDEASAILLQNNSEEYFEKIAKENGLNEAETKSFIQRIKDFIKDFGKWLTQQLGLENTSPEEIANLTQRELFDRITTSMLNKPQENIQLEYNSKGQHLAPNGKPSNLTEAQAKQVRTKAFKNFFGDWENDPENASKVVDENGEPMVMYHSTKSDEFFEFDPNKIGTGAGINYGKGYYFESRKDKAKWYTGGEGRVMEVFLNSKTPVNYYGMTKDQRERADGITDNLTEEDVFEGGQFMVKNPNQIKSATDNIGTFDSNNNDIRFRLGTEETSTEATQQIIDQLQKTGLAENVYRLSTQEIENKLEELGISEELRKQVIAYHGTVRNFSDFLRVTPEEGRYGQVLSGTYFGEGFIAFSFAGGTPFTSPSGKVLKASIDDSSFYTVDMKGSTPSSDQSLINIIGQQEFDKILDLKNKGEIKGLRLENTREFLAGETKPTTQYVVYDNQLVEVLKEYRQEQADVFQPRFQKQIEKNGIKVIPNGFTINNEVYLNKDTMNDTTPIHEFNHLYNSWLRQTRPEVYKKGLNLVEAELGKTDSEIQDVIDFVKNSQPNLEGEPLNEEILTELVGRKGLEKITDQKQSGIIEWLKEAWQAIKDMLGISQMTTEQVLDLDLQSYADAMAVDLLSGENFTPNFNIPEYKGTDFITEIKKENLETDTGITLNMDGSTYEGKGLVVPITSFNTNQSDISNEMISSFLEEHKNKISNNQVKVGLYKFENSDTISIDLNIIVPERSKKVALDFAKAARQESLFNLDNFEDIQTGADGANPMTFSDQEFRLISASLLEGKNPIKDIAKTRPILIPSNNTERLTTDNNGNFVFHHYSKERRPIIKKGSGENIITSREEGSRLSVVGGMAMYYTMQGQKESGVGNELHTVVLPMDTIYDADVDFLGLREEAKRRLEQRRPGQAFDVNYKLALITEIANELGYTMTIANWGGKEVRAQTTLELKPIEENLDFKQREKDTFNIGEIALIRGAKSKITGIKGIMIEYEALDGKSKGSIPNNHLNRRSIIKLEEPIEPIIRLNVFSQSPKFQQQPSPFTDENGEANIENESRNKKDNFTVDEFDGNTVYNFEDGQVGLENYKDGKKVAFANNTNNYRKAIAKETEKGNRIYKDREDTIWESLSENNYSKTKNKETYIKQSGELLDSNNEPSLEAINKYITNTELEDLKPTKSDNSDIMESLMDYDSTSEMLANMEKAMMPNGYFNPTFESLTNNGYTETEATNILDDLSLQNKLKNNIGKLRNADSIIIEHKVPKYREHSSEARFDGKFKTKNPFILRQEAIEVLGGKNKQEFDNAVRSNELFYAKDDFEELSKYRKLNKKEIVNGQLKDYRNTTKDVLEETIIEPSPEQNQTIQDIVYNIISVENDTIEANRDDYYRSLNDLKNIVSELGLDLTMPFSPDIQKTKDFITSIADFFVDNDFDNLADAYDNYYSIRTDVEYEFIENANTKNVLIENPKTVENMFSEHELLKQGDGSYRPVDTSLSVDEMYEIVESYRENTNRKDIEEQVQRYLEREGLNNSDINKKFILYNMYYNESMVFNDNPKQDIKAMLEQEMFNFNTEDALAEINKEIIKEKIKDSEKYNNFYSNLRPTKYGIKIINSDTLSLRKMEPYMTEKLRKHILSQPNGQIKSEKETKDLYNLYNRNFYINFAENAPKPKGLYNYKTEDVVETENKESDFINIDNNVFENTNDNFYRKLPKNDSNYIKVYNINPEGYTAEVNNRTPIVKIKKNYNANINKEFEC